LDQNCIADSLLFGYYDRKVFDKAIDFDDYNEETGMIKSPLEYPSDI
jgi:hypothetical protein